MTMGDELHDDCWQCKEIAGGKPRAGHFHCDSCGAPILHGEDPWYRSADDKSVLCLKCKIEEEQS